jgi:hypothetical protein
LSREGVTAVSSFVGLERATLPAHLRPRGSQSQLWAADRGGRRSPQDPRADHGGVSLRARQPAERRAGGEPVRARPGRRVQGPGALQRSGFRGAARPGGAGPAHHAGLRPRPDRDHRLAPAGPGPCAAVLRGPGAPHRHRPAAVVARPAPRHRRRAGRRLPGGRRSHPDRVASAAERARRCRESWGRADLEPRGGAGHSAAPGGQRLRDPGRRRDHHAARPRAHHRGEGGSLSRAAGQRTAGGGEAADRGAGTAARLPAGLGRRTRGLDPRAGLHRRRACPCRWC